MEKYALSVVRKQIGMSFVESGLDLSEEFGINKTAFECFYVDFVNRSVAFRLTCRGLGMIGEAGEYATFDPSTDVEEDEVMYFEDVALKPNGGSSLRAPVVIKERSFLEHAAGNACSLLKESCQSP